MHRSRLAAKRSPPRFRWLSGGLTRTPLRIHISRLCRILIAGWFVCHRNCIESFFGNHSSSESRNAIQGARAFFTPSLRALETPQRLPSLSTRIRRSPVRQGNRSLPSSDPSSTTMHSKSVNVCRSTESTARGSICTLLKTGMTTETAGISTALRPDCPGSEHPPTRGAADAGSVRNSW